MGGVGVEGVVRRFSPPLSFIVSFIDFLVFRYDNDNCRYRYRYRRFFGLIVSKCYVFVSISNTTRNCWMFRPWAVRAVRWQDVEMSFHPLLGLSPVVMNGYDFGQVGEYIGHTGVLHKVS